MASYQIAHAATLVPKDHPELGERNPGLLEAYSEYAGGRRTKNGGA
jgi:hypothetical protein